MTGKFRKTGSKTMGCSARCEFEAAKAKNAAAIKKAHGSKTSKWEAEWTGSWPALCSDKWIVRKNGMEVDAGDLPFQGEPAGTLNDYSSWSFTSFRAGMPGVPMPGGTATPFGLSLFYYTRAVV